MKMHEGGNAQPTIDREEHRSVNGVNAKAVVPYLLKGTDLIPASPTLDFDHLDITNSATDEDTLTYKLSGSTIRTLVIGYASGAEKVSDSLTSLDYS